MDIFNRKKVKELEATQAKLQEQIKLLTASLGIEIPPTLRFEIKMPNLAGLVCTQPDKHYNACTEVMLPVDADYRLADAVIDSAAKRLLFLVVEKIHNMTAQAKNEAFRKYYTGKEGGIL